MGNEGIYSVGKEFGKTNELFAKQKSFTSTSRDGPSHETLVNLTALNDSSASSHVLHMWPFRGLLLTSYS